MDLDEPAVGELDQALVGKAMPDLTLPSLEDGAPVRLRDATAQGPILVNFFASWCIPCRVEHPLLMRMAAQNNVPLYGVAYKDKPEDSARLLATLGNPYRQVGMDTDGRAGLNFGVYGVPETYVIDGAGIIRRRFVGPLNANVVDKELLPLLRQLGQS